jgi:hypothetical protein
MVDKTDFATPETGISPSGVIRKDGGASAAITNTVSELTNGYYVLTLTNSETNADMIQLRFHDSAASCATQFVVLYPDQAMTYASDVLSTLDDVVGSQIASILIDTASILADTITLSNATYGLNALETLCSDIKDETASILADTKEINSQCDSILADTITLSNATYGLDALETLCSSIKDVADSVLADVNTTSAAVASILADTKEINSQCDSILADTITLSNATYGLDALETIVSTILVDTAEISNIKQIASDIESNVSNISGVVSNILVDTAEISNISGDSGAISAVKDVVDSVLADTKTLSNATYGLDALETIVSTILVDTAEISNISGDSGAISAVKDVVDSVLADTKTLSNATYGLDALETLCSSIKSNVSNVHSTIDDFVGSQLASILVDTGTTLDNKLDSTLVNTVSTQAWGLINSGVVFRGVVTAADPGVSFTIAGLADQGAGAFVDANTPWYAYVFRDGGGAGAAPQGETKKILSYTSATGLFTTEAFTVDVAVGDDILIMNERLAATPEIKADTTSILADTKTTLDDKLDSIIGYTDGIEAILTPL